MFSENDFETDSETENFDHECSYRDVDYQVPSLSFEFNLGQLIKSFQQNIQDKPDSGSETQSCSNSDFEVDRENENICQNRSKEVSKL